DEPRNKTGYRYVFAWMEGGEVVVPEAQAGSSVTPPGGHARPLPGVIRDPQIKKEGNPIPPGKDEIKPTTTADAAGSSSDSSLSQEEKPTDLAPPPDAGSGPEWDEAIQAAGVLWDRPACAIQSIRRETPGATPAIISKACRDAATKTAAGKVSNAQ